MEPRNVLIIKLSAIGDVVMATPVIDALKRAWPRARISWLVEEVSHGLVEDNPHLDEVIVWPKRQWKSLLARRRYVTVFRKAWTFGRALRNKRYDLVLDLQGFLKSGVLAFVSGAHTRIGLASKEGSQFLMTRVIPWDKTDKSMGVQYRQFIEGLGLDPGQFLMDLAVDREEEFVRSFIDRHGLDNGYAVLCPFASVPQKQWPKENFHELAGRLHEAFGIASVLLGGKADREASGKIMPEGGSNVVNAVGEATLKQSAAVIKHASLLVGGDTGLTHMGIAFNVPTVALFGSTYPYRRTGRTNNVLLSREEDCSPCRRRPVCQGDFRCMKGITVEEVFSAAGELLRKEKES